MSIETPSQTPPRAATLKDVAARAGVSKMTASAVLGGRPHNTRFSEATRQRVVEAARLLRYYPSAVAQGLARRRMNAVGVVLSQQFVSLVDDPYVCGLLDGVMTVCARRGQNTTIFTGQTWADAQRSLPVFCDGRCDGLILISPSLDSDVIPALLEARTPFVLVHNSADDPRVCSVSVDNVAPMAQIVGHVVAQGHRRIAFLGGSLQAQSGRDRLAGFRQALAAAGLDADPALVSSDSYRLESGLERTLALLRLDAARRPTALCCGSDKVALGAVRALREAGLRVPEDVSVTGFDDNPDAAACAPPLTTVRLPVRALGERAAEILLARIEAPSAGGRQEVLPTELIVRRSVAPPA